MSSIEHFTPTSIPIMNSLVSASKVVTNESIPNPIPPLVTSHIALPTEIPISTIPIPIMGIKTADNNMADVAIPKELNSEKERTETDSQMSDITTDCNDGIHLNDAEKSIQLNHDLKSDIIMDGDVVQNSIPMDNTPNDILILKSESECIDEDSNVEIIVDDPSEHNDKIITNGAMSIGGKLLTSFRFR
jgi:hypothetical protein